MCYKFYIFETITEQNDNFCISCISLKFEFAEMGDTVFRRPCCCDKFFFFKELLLLETDLYW